MFKLFFALVAIATMITMGIVGQMGKVSTSILEVAPIMIDSDGSLRFPGRAPAPETVHALRLAIQAEDMEKLNMLLVENYLFVAPNNK